MLYRPNSWRALLFGIFKRQQGGAVVAASGAILTENGDDILTEAGDSLMTEGT